MNVFHHMKIGARLAWGFGAVLSLVLLDRYPKVKHAQQIQAELNLQARIMGDLVFMEDLQTRRDDLAILAASRTKTSGLYDGLHRAIHTDRGVALLKDVEAARQQYAQALDRFEQVAAAHDQTAAADLLVMSLRPRQLDYERCLAALIAYQEDLMSQGGTSVDTTLARFQAGLLAVCVGSLVLAGALAWLVARSVTRPMLDVIGSVERVSRGDLTLALRADRRDELGDLQRALLRLKDALSGTVGVVRR